MHLAEDHIRKAFDTISHSTLRTGLQKLGVHERVAEALIAEAEEGQLHFLVPGTAQATQGVKQGRGVRQGSPASPLLCIVGLHEVLQPTVEHMESTRERLHAAGIRRVHHSTNALMAYADDVVPMATEWKVIQEMR